VLNSFEYLYYNSCPSYFHSNVLLKKITHVILYGMLIIPLTPVSAYSILISFSKFYIYLFWFYEN
jgi:hypothetical protein